MHRDLDESRLQSTVMVEETEFSPDFKYQLRLRPHSCARQPMGQGRLAPGFASGRFYREVIDFNEGEFANASFDHGE